MRNEKIFNSWNKIKPDNGASERMLENILSRVHSRKTEKKSHLKIFIPAAACLIIAAFVAVPLLNNTGNSLTLNLSSDNVSVRYVNRLPNLPAVSNMLVHLTEEELFDRYETDIFSGTIRSVRNIKIDFNGHTVYRALIRVEVADIFRGEAETGGTVTILLPDPVNFRNMHVSDTDVISCMKAGMFGIFMPLKYDESHYMEEAGARLYSIDIAEYGMLDGERYAFLDTRDGLVFARWAYESISDAATMEEVARYINIMLDR